MFVSVANVSVSYKCCSFIFCVSATAVRSQSSFSGCPSCPFIHRNETSCKDVSFTKSVHKSGFRTGFPSDFFHDFFCHESSQCLLTASQTYFESVMQITLHFSFNARSPSITAVSSMRLFVVFFSPPLIILSRLP